MKNTLYIILSLLTNHSFGQGPLGKYINDVYNENNYILFHSDSTFKYRLSYHVTHDIACGQYRIIGDTVFFKYLSDMRDTSCNNEISSDVHFDSTLKYSRPIKLFYKDQKLYQIEEGRVKNKVESERKPPKAWGYHRKYLLFGPYVKKDVYYMITESQVKWNKAKK